MISKNGHRKQHRAEPQEKRPGGLFYKLSLTNKILVVTLVLLVVLGTAGTLTFWWAVRTQLFDELGSMTRTLAVETASRAGALLEQGDTDALDALLREIQGIDESIAYVVLVDREGEVVGHTFSWDPPEAVVGTGITPPVYGDDEYRRIEIDGEAYLDVEAPVVTGVKGAGWIKIGVHTDRIDRFIGKVSLMFFAVLAVLTLVGMLIARAFYRRMTRPVVELTHLADKVSVGNLDVEFDIGRAVKCWEIKNCRREDCAAYGRTSVQCWFVDGTPCEGYESRFPQKLVGCRTCEVYRAHKGDEIVQLADSFRHMTHDLQGSRMELERSIRFQRSLIQNSYVGIIATDETDTVQIFNRVAQDLTGYTESEVVGEMTWERLFDPETTRWDDRPLVGGAKAIFGFYRREVALRPKVGGALTVRATGTTLREEGKTIGKVFFVMDLREVQDLRADLIRSERLAATGQTVASISHSIKNILDGLRGGAYIYRRGVRGEDAAGRTQGWATVEKNIDLISELVADLLNFARDREPDLEDCDPNQLVTDVVANLAGKAEMLDVFCETDLDPTAVPSQIDSHSMHQCLTNLVTNAIDAASGQVGGHVTVATSADDDVLEFVVSDNGPGVAPEVARDLFSGMVSTKGSKGTGLGLLVVHKVVTEHRGTVRLDGKQGHGAVFRVRIPRREPPVPGYAEKDRPALRQAPRR